MSTKKEEHENRLQRVLEALERGIQEESDSENAEKVENIIKDYPYMDIQDPEKCGDVIFLALDTQADLLSRTAMSHIEMDEGMVENKNAIQFVYKHYTFVQNHLENVIEKYEGRVCVSDKSRSIISCYLKSLKTGKVPAKSEGYWVPPVSVPEIWLDWIDAMRFMYFGETYEYSQKRELIENAYQARNEKRKAYLSRVYTESAYFVKIEESLSEGKKEKGYHFLNEKTNDRGIIFVNEAESAKYRFYHESEGRWHRYKDTLPDWFVSLLNEGRNFDGKQENYSRK